MTDIKGVMCYVDAHHNVSRAEDIINKITYFENNASEYENMKRLQKQLLEKRYAQKPANDLYNAYIRHCKVEFSTKL